MVFVYSKLHQSLPFPRSVSLVLPLIRTQSLFSNSLSYSSAPSLSPSICCLLSLFIAFSDPHPIPAPHWPWITGLGVSSLPACGSVALLNAVSVLADWWPMWLFRERWDIPSSPVSVWLRDRSPGSTTAQVYKIYYLSMRLVSVGQCGIIFTNLFHKVLLVQKL